MRRLTILGGAILLSGLLAAAPVLGGESSVEKGKALFSDPKLGGGKTGKSCNSCHENGKGLEKAAGKKDLAGIINQCVVQNLGGAKLDGRSVEMRSLKMYIESLAPHK